MFTKKPAPDRKRPAGGSGGGQSVTGFSVLGADLAVTGNITAAADLHIDGKVEGDIACSLLVQGETSEIAGAVTAQRARIAGRIDGAVSVGDLVVLATARISGDITYDSLTIEPGAQVSGQFMLREPGNCARGESQLLLAASNET